MQDVTQDDVIALIYEAASGQLHWRRALEETRRLLDCLIVQIVGVDVKHRHIVFSFESEGTLAEAAIDYARTYHRIDPHAAYVASGDPGQLIAFSRVFNQAFVDGNAFYQEFLIPYGSRHMHGAKLHEADGVATMLGIHRGVGQSPLEGTDWQAAQRICFHLTRAAHVFSNTRKQAASGTIAQDLLNRLPMPVYLADIHRRVVMRNRAALAVALPSAPLRVDAENMLECMNLDADQRISLALASMHKQVSSEIPDEFPRRTIARIKRSGRSGNYLLCMDRIWPNETMGVFGHQPMLMITQHELGVGLQLDPFFVASAFDLTPAESMVASATASGLSQKEIARRKGVSIHTIQAQIKSIYSKLGVRKSTELAALLLSMSAGAIDRSSQS